MRRNLSTLQRILNALPLHRVLLLAIGMAFMLPAPLAVPAHADIGPKPSMSFTFAYHIPKVAITDGQMLECQDADCRTGKPLEQLGPQGFRCGEYDCSAMAYGFADYHKLVITFADGVTRESNIFAKSGNGGDFAVTVTGEALKVEAKRGLGSVLWCVPSWALTLVVETLIAGLYMSALHLPRALLGVAPLASLFTLPVVWFAFPQLALPWLALMGLAEFFAVVFETGFVYAFTHWTMPLRHAAILSLLMNAASFGLGFLGNLPL